MADIRRATLSDIPALVEMGRALHDESPRYQGMEYSEAKVAGLAERIITGPLSETAVIVVADIDGVLVGMFVAVVADRWFCDEKYVTDLTVYVRPHHRGGRTFFRLAMAFEQWATYRGVMEKAIGVSTEINAEQTVHAYKRLGYRLAGYTMVKHGN